MNRYHACKLESFSILGNVTLSNVILCMLLQDVDVDLKKSNQESLLEAGSLLLIDENLSSPEVPSLYTRIRNLQRLKAWLLSLFFIIRSLYVLCKTL